MKSFLTPFLNTAKESLLNLNDVVQDELLLEAFINDFGWEAEIESTHLSSVQSLFDVSSLIQTVDQLFQDIQHQASDESELAESMLGVLNNAYKHMESLSPNAQSGLPAVFSNPAFWEQMRSSLPDYLLATYLRDQKPAFFAFLLFSGVVEQTYEIPSALDRVPYTRIKVQWGKLAEFIGSPSGELRNRFGWGTDKIFDYQKFLTTIGQVLEQLRLPVRLMLPPHAISDTYFLASDIETKDIFSLTIPIVHGVTVTDEGFIEFGIRLTPIPKAAADASTNKAAGPVAGLLLTPAVKGNYSHSIPLTPELSLMLLGAFQSDNAIGLEIFPDKVNTVSAIGSTILDASLRLVWQPRKPLVLLGAPDSSRIEATGFSGGVSVMGTAANPELLIQFGAGTLTNNRISLVLEPSEGNGFISKILGTKPVAVDLDGDIQWSSKRGFGINGSIGLLYEGSLHRSIGPVAVQSYRVALTGDGGGNTLLIFGLGARVTLGPFTAIAENFGVNLKLLNKQGSAEKGVLNNLDIDWGFKSPSGIGVSIASEAVKGGGYLYLDPASGRYAGVAGLEVGKLKLKALGILEPVSNGSGYSMLFLVFGEFNPVQLGMGFTLSGVGGLLGTHRSANLERLREGVRTGELARLLFPADPVGQAPQVLSSAGQFFPVTEGRYVFGLMGRIGWGTPTLLTLDVGVAIELPAPVRVALFGVLQALLPNDQKPLVRLQAAFLGSLDMGRQQASFDASLYDSRLLQFPLSGDVAFRLHYGENPMFLVSAGGFHPAFQPPAGVGLERLRRIAIALSTTADLSLLLSSYLAVTSNTVQLGSHLDLRYKINRYLDIVAFLGFDALLQLSPLWSCYL